MDLVEHAWAGIDTGKGHHHVVVIDSDGRRMLSRRVVNGEPDLSEIIGAAMAVATRSSGRSIWLTVPRRW
ncbi:MAG: hypothetical protein DLM57_10240 [Pseudonocardiales bacterium]|nr:MAG: hypothetical protein DLM57_10240 [Pseudonocardiales bacterium]